MAEILRKCKPARPAPRVGQYSTTTRPRRRPSGSAGCGATSTTRDAPAVRSWLGPGRPQPRGAGLFPESTRANLLGGRLVPGRPRVYKTNVSFCRVDAAEVEPALIMTEREFSVVKR